jgi:hypothetical protein
MLVQVRKRGNFSEWSALSSVHFNPGKDLEPLVQETGRVSGTVWKGPEISPPPAIDSRTLQPVAICFKVYATPTVYSIYMLTELSRITLRGSVFQHIMSLLSIDRKLTVKKEICYFSSLKFAIYISEFEDKIVLSPTLQEKLTSMLRVINKLSYTFKNVYGIKTFQHGIYLYCSYRYYTSLYVPLYSLLILWIIS